MHWMHRHRLLIVAAIATFWTGLVLVAHYSPRVPFLSGIWRSEQGFQDLLRREGRKTPTRKDFVFVGIDQESAEFKAFDEAQLKNSRALQLMAAKTFPWSREVWALFLDRVFSAGAKLVVFDVIFGPDNPGDPVFRAALDKYHDKVVLGANFDLSGQQNGVADLNGRVTKNIPPNQSL